MTGEVEAQSPARAAAQAANDPEHMRELRLQRNLKILVAGMGFLILAGLAAVAIRMVGFSSGSKSASPAAVAAPRTAGGTVRGIALELPKGARVVSISVSGSRLAVHHESPEGTGIAVIDTDTGERIADIKPQETLPSR